MSFLAAKVASDGSCSPVHSVLAGTSRPLGSMFKLFVLGALANAVHEHRVSWTQKVAVTAAIKVGGSGTLQNSPDGTELTVEQVAVKMISISDNTAADMLLSLVGRGAVEDQVRAWSSHASIDIPFLTVKELFALKYHDFPALADHYLSLPSSQRASYLATTVDKVPASAEQSTNLPRAINSIEWFASADDLCRALSGLAKLQAVPALSPLGTVLSTNSGGIDLSAGTWPRIWFKGGSEPGVLTLGYLARDSSRPDIRRRRAHRGHLQARAGVRGGRDPGSQCHSRCLRSDGLSCTPTGTPGQQGQGRAVLFLVRRHPTVRRATGVTCASRTKGGSTPWGRAWPTSRSARNGPSTPRRSFARSRYGPRSRASWRVTGSTTTPGSMPGVRKDHGFLFLLFSIPPHALARLIVLDGTEADIRNLWEGFYYVRVSVLAVRQPYRTRRDGVKVGASARGMPVELCVHRSAMTCEWSTWVVEREIGRAELVARRYASYDAELRRLLAGEA